MRVLNLICRCVHTPSSWSFVTFQERPVIVQYNRGILEVLVGKPYAGYNSVSWEDVICKKKLNNSLKFHIKWIEVKKIIKELPDNCIDLVFFNGEI